MFKLKILKYLASYFLNAVFIEELLRVEKQNSRTRIFIGKRELTNDEILKLKSEGQIFENSLIWNLIRNNIYWIANIKMQKGANKEEDMYMGRAMTLTIDTLEEFIDKLKAL